jgi:RES domain
VGDFRTAVLPAGAEVCRSFQFKWGYDSFNPGRGDTRFAPLTTAAGETVPTFYGGVDDVVALLETVFHDVHHDVQDRIIYEAVVRQWGVAFVRLPRDLVVVDVRDEALNELGMSRSQLITTTAEHYCCTREWARWLHAHRIGRTKPVGILWHSRQAELHAPTIRREVFVLWGDRAPSEPGKYPLTGPGVRNLTEGIGRVLLDQLAEDLDARIEPADD